MTAKTLASDPDWLSFAKIELIGRNGAIVKIAATQVADLPSVAISDFKANPAQYATGARITNHGKVQAAYLPVGDDAPVDLDAIKAQLLLLGRLRNPADVAVELREIAEQRGAETVGEPR